MPFAGFEDFSECKRTMEEDGHDEESAESICGALQAEAKSDSGNVDELRESLKRGAGLVADVGVDLVSGVDVPAVNSKWTMFKSESEGHDWEATSPVLLSKEDADEKRISYAAAMIPRTPDKEGDVVPTPTVEKAAHDFLKQDGGVDTDHSLIDGDGDVVESWVLKEERTFDLPGDGTETYGAGTWMVGIKWAAEPWDRIKSGELTGLSIYGMAEHVQLDKSVEKQLTVPFADEAVVELVYASENVAAKAADEMGMEEVAHAHEFDGNEMWMPGPDHETYVEAYNDIADGDAEMDASVAKEEDPCWEGYTMVGTDENGNPRCVPDDDVPDVDFEESLTPAETKEVSAAKSENGDTLNRQDAANDGMGNGDDNDDSPTVAEVAASVEDLTETVNTIKEAIETEKAPGESLGDLIEEFAERVSETEGVDKESHAVEDILRDSLADAEKENDGEMDDEDEDDEEMEADADGVEKRTEDAQVDKGYDGEETRKSTLDDSGATSSGMPSYADAAADHGGD